MERVTTNLVLARSVLPYDLFSATFLTNPLPFLAGYDLLSKLLRFSFLRFYISETETVMVATFRDLSSEMVSQIARHYVQVVRVGEALESCQASGMSHVADKTNFVQR